MKKKDLVEIDGVLVSQDIFEEYFCCDLNACKGACCVEGEAGAPVKDEEVSSILQKIPKIRKYLSKDSIEVLEKEGAAIKDLDGEWVTPTIRGKECIYAFYDKKGILKCSFEQEWSGEKTDFKKPVSCHLYPIREVKLFDSVALNYHQWEICSSACDFGKRNKIPLYEFLKESLVRRFGVDWYNALSEIAEQLKKGPKPL